MAHDILLRVCILCTGQNNTDSQACQLSLSKLVNVILDLDEIVYALKFSSKLQLSSVLLKSFEIIRQIL